MTTTPTTPITLLSAVNEMLAAVGTAQVATLDTSSTNEEVQKALNTLKDVSVRVQSDGWGFNVEDDFPLNPDPVTGYIALPANALFMGVSTKSRDRYPTQRQGNLYDIKNHTFQWANGSNGIVTPNPLVGSGSDLGTIYVKLQFTFDFEDCPQPIRWLIMAEAGRMWGVGRVPDSATFKFTDAVYEEALARAIAWDNDATSFYPEQNPHFSAMRRR